MTKTLLTLVVLACLTMTVIRLHKDFEQFFEVENAKTIH